MHRLFHLPSNVQWKDAGAKHSAHRQPAVKDDAHVIEAILQLVAPGLGWR
jgi:hypothetical protein